MINDATKRNLRRKSSYIDKVQYHEGIPLFSWIDLNLTELCNRKCVFCPRIDDAFYPNQNLHMALPLVEKLAQELQELDYQGAVVLCGFGEPMLHPQFVEIVSILGRHHRVELVTNGDKLNASNALRLYDAGLDYFVVSMYDGPHQEAYFKALFSEAGLAPETYILRDRWHSEEDDFGLKLTNRAGTINIGHQDPVVRSQPCYYPSYSMTFDWNGDALLCVQDWHKRVKAGNLFAQHIFDIWKSPTMAKYRQRLIKGKRTVAPCSNCNADGTLHGFNHCDAWKSLRQTTAVDANS